MTHLTVWKQFMTAVDDHWIKGLWAIQDGVVKVRTPMGNQCDQLASRQAVAGIRPSSAPSCSRTGSRSPSIASRKTERANSSGFTVVLPFDLSVSQASRRKPPPTPRASENRRSCCGNRALPHLDFLRMICVISEALVQAKLWCKLGQVCDPRWTISRRTINCF
jgi:hypothetical protein